MKVGPLFLLLGLFGKASAESCACVAEDLGFTIDCANTAAMLEAMTYLNTNGCATACGSDDCVLNYYIVQAHHAEKQVLEKEASSIASVFWIQRITYKTLVKFGGFSRQICEFSNPFNLLILLHQCEAHY